MNILRENPTADQVDSAAMCSCVQYVDRLPACIAAFKPLVEHQSECKQLHKYFPEVVRDHEVMCTLDKLILILAETTEKTCKRLPSEWKEGILPILVCQDIIVKN